MDINMTRQEKAIKIVSNLESLNKYYSIYVLFYQCNLTKLEFLEKYKHNELFMWDCEWKVYNKLYPIIYNKKTLTN